MQPMIACIAAITAGLFAATSAHAHRPVSAHDVAQSFVPTIESFIAALPIETERFDVRVNRCTGRQGELSDLMFYIWVGWRGAERSGNAARVLEDVHDTWKMEDWTITRYRHLDNGGLNIAATDPATGNAFSLDSGLNAGPGIYVVGLFSTPCHEHSPGAAPFGRLEWGAD